MLNALGGAVFKNLTLNNLVNPLYSSGDPDSKTNFNLTQPFNYRDTWNVAAGVHYQMNDTIMLKLGAGFDQTPTNDKDRDIRLPGVNRLALAIGARANLRNKTVLDVGWTHFIPVGSAQINTQGPQGIPYVSIATSGQAKMNANVIGAQITLYL